MIYPIVKYGDPVLETPAAPVTEFDEKLHKLMANLGFGRTVTGSNSAHDLPHATYYGNSSATVSAVRDTVRDKVKAQIQNKILVFVAQTETWALGW